MAEHDSAFSGPETQEDFLADRQRFFHGFTQFTLFSTLFLAALLALMAIFLV